MKLRSMILACSIFLIFLLEYPTQAQDNNTRTLIAMGSSYSETLQGFWDVIGSQNNGKDIRIVLLPLAYSSNPRKITKVERNEYLRKADQERSRIEADCQQHFSPGSKCIVTLIPILVRSDTNNKNYIKSVEDHPTAILIVGEEQTNAMQVLTGTPVEIALSTAYQDGVIIAGASAGAGIQSTSMIAGYKNGFGVMNSMNFGASDVWQNPLEHGLLFGLQDTIVDPLFHEQNRFGRLLNAITLPDTPHLGIGIDAETGLQIVNEDILKNVFGQNTITILDAKTYHSAEAVQYQGLENHLSIRNVLFHLLSPGDYSYSLQERKHSLAPFLERVERQFNNLGLPPGTGSIIVSNNAIKNPSNNPLLARFVNMSGGKNANLLVVAAGYYDEKTAQETANELINALNVRGETYWVNPVPKEPLKISKEITGIILLGGDLFNFPLESISTIYDAWFSGMPLFIEGSASAIVGKYFSSDSITFRRNESRISLFHRGDVEISSGLSLLNLNIEPKVMEQNRWAQFFSLAYQHPEILTLGLTEGAAIAFSSNGVMALGDNVIITLDLSEATLGVGTNQGFVIANGLLDVFAPGDLVEPSIADIKHSPVRISTPSIFKETLTPPSFTATSTINLTPSLVPLTKPNQQSGVLKTIPTMTVQPAYTSAKILPADPNLARLIIGAGILIVMVVILGVWMNRQRLR